MKTIESTIPTPIYPAIMLSDKSSIPLCRTAFFDMETTGLAPDASSIYLIGFMKYDVAQECYRLTQWFADNYHSEKLILTELLSALTDVDRLCHFNGKTFDIPYVLKKCRRHKIDVPSHCLELFEAANGMESLDLLQEIRPLKKLLGLARCNQTAVEHWLGIQREDPFNGKELTLVYSEYMQKKLLNPPDSEKLLSALLLHNHDDIAMLPALCSVLNYKEYLTDNGQDNPLLTEENLADMTVHYSEAEQLLTLTLSLPVPLPREITLTGQYAPQAGKSSADTLTTPIGLTDFSTALATQPDSPAIPTAGAAQTGSADIPTAPAAQANPKIFPSGNWQLILTREQAHYQIPVYTGSLKYFLPDYTNYYYLPEEDTAIHKSVAGFVDSSHRKKATAATCFNRREGRFLPQLYYHRSKKSDSSPLPVFREEYKSFPAFCELPEDFHGNRKFWREYLSAQMPGLTKI